MPLFSFPFFPNWNILSYPGACEVQASLSPRWMIDCVSLEDDQVIVIDMLKGITVISYIFGVHHSPKYQCFVLRL